MKRTLVLSVALAFLAPVVFVGCGEETKKETTEKVVTPTGSETKTKTETDKKTGDAK